MSTGKKLDVIGHARRRVDARAKVTGQLRFADDLTLNFARAAARLFLSAFQTAAN